MTVHSVTASGLLSARVPRASILLISASSAAMPRRRRITTVRAWNLAAAFTQPIFEGGSFRSVLPQQLHFCQRRGGAAVGIMKPS